VGLFGLFVMTFLEAKKVAGALVIGILSSTVLAAVCKQVQLPTELVSLQLNLKAVALRLDILAALKLSFFGPIFALMFMDMFDSIGTLIACAHQARMVDAAGNVRNLDRLLAIDACATMFSALCGTSTTTAYIESAAGIEQGGRSGLTSVVTGVLFLLALPFVPLVAIVPQYATAPALIMVGLFMAREVKRIDFTNLSHGLPAAFASLARLLGLG
jgi:AGZA family xanthine/uracil permease-like MFS transporter